jgi:hypothetical protein
MLAGTTSPIDPRFPNTRLPDYHSTDFPSPNVGRMAALTGVYSGQLTAVVLEVTVLMLRRHNLSHQSPDH